MYNFKTIMDMRRIKIYYTILLAFLIAIFNSCTHNETSKSSANTDVVCLTKSIKIVHVYFFEGFDNSLGEVTMNELKHTFDSVAFEGIIPFPDSAYYAPRNRYKADKLIRHLRHMQSSPSELIIGFSSKDISCSVHGYNDFGVMGLTICPLHTAVVSTHRLAVKKRIQSDFLKLVLHELGHAEGLPHCTNDSTCYMRDANKQNHFPELNSFCEKCETHLAKRGWKF